MTKVTVLGQEPKEEKKLKSIEITHCLQNASFLMRKDNWNDVFKNNQYKEVRVVKIGYDNAYKHTAPFDAVFIADDGCIFLGNFNDGVV